MISLAMIVKNADEHIAATIKSAEGVFDELVVVDTGSTDGTVETAKRLGAKVFHFDWIEDFSAARNFAFSKCSEDLILWLDADDLLVGGPKLREVAERWFTKKEDPADILYLKYNYARDEMGNVIVEHMRERLIRKGYTTWQRFIHEICSPTRPCRIIKASDFPDIYVDHDAKADDNKAKNERNLRIIEYNADKDKKVIEQAWVHLYWGNALRGLGRFDEAITHYMIYLEKSDWDEERQLVAINCSEIKRQQKQYPKALEWGWQAIRERNVTATAWLELAWCYRGLKKYRDVLSCLRHLSACEAGESVIVANPTALRFAPLFLSTEACVKLAAEKDEDSPLIYRAKENVGKLLALYPHDETVKQLSNQVEKAHVALETMKSYVTLVDRYTADGNKRAAMALQVDPPKAIEHFAQVAKPVRADGSPRMIIFCGETSELWGPKSIEKGIGGSETAVIHLSDAMSRRGWAVEVYCSNDYRGLAGKVAWNGWWEINENIDCDVFVAWRVPQAIRNAPGLVKMVWNHDLPIPQLWSPDVIEKCDLAAILSKWHKEQFAFLPDDKLWLTRNGINLQWLAEPNQDREHQLRCIYTSSPDRGLENLLMDVWPRILKEVPDAKLDIYYGFTPTYDKENASKPTKMAWKEKMLELLHTTRGVEYHGRAGQKDLARAFARSHFWLYPTSFGEISCITAIEAQAMGAIPATSGFAAVAETQRFGIKIGEQNKPIFDIDRKGAAEKMAKEVIELWRNPAACQKLRQEMVSSIRELYSWEQVADQWDKKLKEMLVAKQTMAKV